MAKTRFIQNSFTSGVLSPLLKGRTDIQQYYNGLETGDNVLLLPQGGLKRRAGTKFISEALPVMTRNTTLPTTPNGGTPANINDEDDSTTTTTTNNISTTDPYVVAQYDLGASTYIEFCDVRQISLTSLTSNEFKIQTSDDAAAWTTRNDVPLIGTNPQDFRLLVGVSARYFRLVRIGSTDLGTDKVTLSEFNVWEKSGTASNVKLKDFSVNTSTHYLLAITDGNTRIFKNGTDQYVADIKTPFLSAEVGDVRDVQSEQVVLLFHEDHETVRIINLGTDTDWTQDTAPYTNVPQFDYNDSLSPTPSDDVQDLTFNSFTIGQQFQIDVEGVLSKNITYAGSTTADEQSSTAENIRKNLQDMPNFGDTGIAVAFQAGTTYRITISGESTKDFELFAGFPTTGAATDNITFAKVSNGVSRREDVWSSTRGWPKTACYYEGRLVIGGTKSKPQSIFASKSGSAYNFEIDEGDDDDAIFATISARTLSDITDVFPGRNLQVFTAGSEFAVLQSPITPQSFGVVPQTSHGTLNLEAKEIDGATIVADRNGKTIREFIYSFNEDAYIANDISVLSPEIIKNPVDIAIIGGTASEDANWVFIVNDDGTATVLNTLRSQDINGFTTWSTDGSIKDVSVVDDDLYMVVTRTVNGATVWYIEKWDFSLYVDSGTSYDFGGTPSASLTALDYLEGRTVRVRADDADMGEFTVSSGTVTLPRTTATAQVGLAYTPQFRGMPISTNVGSGSNINRRKKILRMNIRTLDTQGLYIDGNPTPVRAFSESAASPLDNAPKTTSGIIGDIYDVNGWNRETMPLFSQPDPMPFTILNIEYEVESS